MQIFVKILILLFILFSSSYADKVNVFEFTDIELSNLEVRKVRGADNKTEYHPKNDPGPRNDKRRTN